MAETAHTKASVLRSEEGQSYWFLDSLVTVKVSGSQTSDRLTVLDFLNPPGFAPPTHRHLVEDEIFYVLSGSAVFFCDGETFDAGPGDTVFLPVGSTHSFRVADDQPFRTLQITVPSGFEEFTAEAGTPATGHVLPSPGPIDFAAVGQAAARHNIEILGPPPAK
ncbi:cupin domain-containing protein [Lacisediminihabitans profunda]|uniref:Cupin domain-containing protein n=1 Tax=Lacisediminihabitans profunda TaxID=2594790 RepID=A0A5C8UML7_9MICO|nr:cupin domain-containing protein [Lacisediminihabitans profunda]TXN29161.1 cupin domain-containing protein [Lacisediminihabitans profunda]